MNAGSDVARCPDRPTADNVYYQPSELVPDVREDIPQDKFRAVIGQYGIWQVILLP